MPYRIYNFNMNIIFIANDVVGDGMSGGDRIWMNFVKYWRKKINIILMCSEDANNMLIRGLVKNEIIDITHIIITAKKGNSANFNNLINLFKYQIKRTFKGIKMVYHNLELVKNSDFVYSSSDFYPDLMPAFFAKIINKRIKWIAGYYLIAPFPISDSTPYKSTQRLKGFIYWLMQKLSLFIVKHFADYVFVTSEPDVKRFISKRVDNSKVIVVKGGVDIKASENYMKEANIIPIEKRKYDACYVGRFHPQKGVLELIDIWNILRGRGINAKLAIIGCGELEEKIVNKINEYDINDNIKILGFLDGKEKYEVFRNSKMILHPAIYDSGGMAMAEGMAFGLPGVSFDLEALKSYYPKGVLKVPCFNLEAFANVITQLLKDKELYDKFSREALEYTKTWDWEERANFIFSQIFNN